MWDLPGPGLEPVSPALAGGFLTIAPPGKPKSMFLMEVFLGLNELIILGIQEDIIKDTPLIPYKALIKGWA